MTVRCSRHPRTGPLGGLLVGLVDGGPLLGAGVQRLVCAGRRQPEVLDTRLARLDELAQQIASYAVERVDWCGPGRPPGSEAVQQLLRRAITASESGVARVLLADVLLRWEALDRLPLRPLRRGSSDQTLPRLLALVGRAGHAEHAQERRVLGHAAPAERVSYLEAVMTGAQAGSVFARLTRRFLAETVRAAMTNGPDAEAGAETLVSGVAGVVERDELVLDYQPVVDLVSGELLGVEALVRWQHPTRGLLPPSVFLGLADSAGELTRIGNWVLLNAAAQVQSWQRRYGRPDLVLAVNVSRGQLELPVFPEIVRRVLDSVGLAPGSLVFEVRERDLGDAGGRALRALEELRGRGVRVALDDFGAGPASLRRLEQLPLDIAKIDRSFVRRGGEGGEEMLQGIIVLARHLGLDVVADGIEREEDLDVVQALGCSRGQGFLLSGPVSPQEIDRWLATGTTVPVVELARQHTGAPREGPAPELWRVTRSARLRPV